MSRQKTLFVTLFCITTESLDLVMCDESDDDLVEVHVEPGYMTQNFHKMVNFKMKTNTENKIVKKI